MSAIKDVYKFLHDNYDYRKKWDFVHYFVYVLTIGMFIVSVAVLAVAALICIGFLIAEYPTWFIPVIVAVVAGILAVLFWSLLTWINHD